MNWEAFFAVGVFTLILGVFLYIPARFWVKRKLKKHPEQAIIKVTSFGFVFYGFVVAFLLGGFSTQFLAPNTSFGELMSSKYGRIIYAGVLVIVFFVVELVFKKLGFKVIESSEKNV